MILFNKLVCGFSRILLLKIFQCLFNFTRHWYHFNSSKKKKKAPQIMFRRVFGFKSYEFRICFLPNIINAPIPFCFKYWLNRFDLQTVTAQKYGVYVRLEYCFANISFFFTDLLILCFIYSSLAFVFFLPL